VTPRLDRETTDERIARLRQATEALSPPVDLAGRLARGAMGAARAGRRGISAVVLPFGRRALVAAAFAAAASVALAIQGVHQEDEALTGDAADTAFWEP
jgi:hypothetical protein